jgi:hypothetical protein
VVLPTSTNVFFGLVSPLSLPFSLFFSFPISSHLIHSIIHTTNHYKYIRKMIPHPSHLIHNTNKIIRGWVSYGPPWAHYLGGF